MQNTDFVDKACMEGHICVRDNRKNGTGSGERQTV